jgi:hypothetical protein
VSVVETVLVYVLAPAVLYGAVALLTIARKAARRPKYRSGQAWEHEPVLWTANPEGAHLAPHDPHAIENPAATTGGARGHW